jgi:hypothetical protein
MQTQLLSVSCVFEVAVMRVQEMRSLHHEIEALQSRILARLNSNPSDLPANTERIPSH